LTAEGRRRGICIKYGSILCLVLLLRSEAMACRFDRRSKASPKKASESSPLTSPSTIKAEPYAIIT